jgi:hypothetical protein
MVSEATAMAVELAYTSVVRHQFPIKRLSEDCNQWNEAS